MAFFGETLRQFVAGSSKIGEYSNTQWTQWEKMRELCAAEASRLGLSPTLTGSTSEPNHTEVKGHYSDVVAQLLDSWRCSDGRYRSLVELVEQVRSYASAFASAPSTSPAPTPNPTPVPSKNVSADRLWTGRWSAGVKEVGGRDDKTSTYGNVQYERASGGIKNSPASPRVPVVSHPLLGECLKLSLASGDKRHEVSAAGNADAGWDPGDENWCGFTFCLDGKFPLSSSDPWNIVSQVHQSSGSGSPPLEFDARSGALRIRGDSRGYDQKVCDIVVNRVYDVVFGLKLGRGKGSSVINVYVDGKQLIRDFRAPIDFGSGCYWKVATAYANPKISPRPVTNYQKNHRIGRTYASVA